jgi:hypothetical protein
MPRGRGVLPRYGKGLSRGRGNACGLHVAELGLKDYGIPGYGYS